MFKIMEGVPKGELVECEGAMVRNMGDTLNVMNLRPPCLRVLGYVMHEKGSVVAKRYDSGLEKIAETSRHISAAEAIRYLVRSDSAS